MIDDYCDAHTTSHDDALNQVYRSIFLHTPLPHISSTPYQGRLLSMLVSLAKPQVAVELGVFGAYSTIAIARSLPEGAMLHAVEAEVEYEQMIRYHLHIGGVDNRVRLYFQPASEAIPSLPDNIDFAFVDADKLNYQNYFNALLPKMSRGGLLLFDNVLWYGKVADSDCHDATSVHLRQLNEMVQNDPRVENLLLPVRDGIMLCRVL